MMVGQPSIPIVDIANFPAKIRKQMQANGVSELAQLFLAENKLIDAVKLAKITDISIREALEARQAGRRHMENILANITAKRKVEPLELLWKIHWLLGTVPEGDHRLELLALEGSAISTFLENLETTQAQTIDRILMIFLHRLLVVPETTLKAEYQQLIDFTEKYQRRSLLAYQITKAKPVLLTLSEETEPTKLIVQLRKLQKCWKSLFQAIKQRNDTQGMTILTALQAMDSLEILDLSEHHLKDRIEQTMTTTKLRQSQLTQITTAMNAAVELRDAYLTAKLATRASQIWFELAQGKPGKAFGDDLLRSLRFSRTATFHYRASDSLSGAVKQLEHLVHLIGEIPSDPTEALEEAVTGVLQTFVSTTPLLDRPADETFLLRTSKRIDTIINRLIPQLSSRESRYQLAQLHVQFQQTIIKQLQQLGTEPTKYKALNREFIQALLRLAGTAPDEEKQEHLKTATEHTNQIIAESKQIAKISEQDLEVISAVAFHLAQYPAETLSEPAKQLLEQTHQLNEQLYFQTKDPQIRAQLALQLLLSKIIPDSSGKILATFSSKELDKLEEFATTALVANAKAKKPNETLKAGSVLVWIVIQRLRETQEATTVSKLKDDARDFAEKTFTFTPSATELTGETFPFGFLLLRDINELVHDERPEEDSQWEQLLTQSEQFAQTLAKAASARGETTSHILALSAAGTATAKLATITSSVPQQLRLLRRATTQIQKALQAASTQGNPRDIEAALSQYDQLMRARLTMATSVPTQLPIFKEWNQTYIEAIKALETTDASDSVNRLHAYRILNAQVPLTFSFLSEGKMNIDTARRNLTELLQEAGQIGSPDQAKLAQQLERRWAFQLGEDSLLTAGFRLEDAETNITLADEHFRFNLQFELQLDVNGQTTQKLRSFPFLRISPQPNDLIWYDETPILCSTYSNEGIYTCLTLQDPSESHIGIGLWLVAAEELTATVTFHILAVEALSQDSEGVAIQLVGAQVHLPKPPVVAERRETKGVLLYELALKPGYPETLQINIQIA
ncbi:MAG: hypothetical protein ACFE8O_09170 [Candidatus Hermodarchaeota archaeon]